MKERRETSSSIPDSNPDVENFPGFLLLGPPQSLERTPPSTAGTILITEIPITAVGGLLGFAIGQFESSRTSVDSAMNTTETQIDTETDALANLKEGAPGDTSAIHILEQNLAQHQAELHNLELQHTSELAHAPNYELPGAAIGAGSGLALGAAVLTTAAIVTWRQNR